MSAGGKKSEEDGNSKPLPVHTSTFWDLLGAGNSNPDEHLLDTDDDDDAPKWQVQCNILSF